MKSGRPGAGDLGVVQGGHLEQGAEVGTEGGPVDAIGLLVCDFVRRRRWPPRWGGSGCGWAGSGRAWQPCPCPGRILPWPAGALGFDYLYREGEAVEIQDLHHGGLEHPAGNVPRRRDWLPAADQGIGGLFVPGQSGSLAFGDFHGDPTYWGPPQPRTRTSAEAGSRDSRFFIGTPIAGMGWEWRDQDQ